MTLSHAVQVRALYVQAMAEKDKGRAAAEHADGKGTHAADKKNKKPRAKTAYQVSMPAHFEPFTPVCEEVSQPERPYTPVTAAFRCASLAAVIRYCKGLTSLPACSCSVMRSAQS